MGGVARPGRAAHIRQYVRPIRASICAVMHGCAVEPPKSLSLHRHPDSDVTVSGS